jgi:hypothetical protein
MANVLFCVAGLAFVGLVAATIRSFIKKGWRTGVIHSVLVLGCGVATLFAFGFLMLSSMFGPSEDGFADNLTIPDGIEIADPDQDTTDPWGANPPKGRDEF